jgi:hypothetical protein
MITVSEKQMISPHLLKVVESYSTSLDKSIGMAQTIAHSMWSDRPAYTIEPKSKKSKWCHMIMAQGPAINEGSKRSELIVIWWSEMGPDTERVLSAIDWEKHAKDV